MFKFLKEKLKQAIEKISRKTEKEIEESIQKEKVGESKTEEQPKEEKKGFIKKVTETITTRRISESKFDEIFHDLEITLLENNVALEVIDKIKEDLKKELLEKQIKKSQIETIIKNSLALTIKGLFIDPLDLLSQIKKTPFVICFIGINGSGKTTTIAKIANLLLQNKKSCVLAAADTFRAASIEQLQYHADELGIKMIKHDYGSDPAAVAFDALAYAKSKKKDVVLIDTSGRLQTNQNLIDELKKIVRVANPDLTIFVGEAITGNDCIEQARKFNEDIGIDAIILAKQDVDEKGGAAISISYITKRPILYIGTGQKYSDIEKFDKNKIIKQLGLNGT